MRAACNGEESVCRVLLEHGAHVNGIESHGWTALMFSAECGHPSVCRLLLRMGANVNACGKDGWTALMKAASNGHAGMQLRFWRE